MTENPPVFAHYRKISESNKVLMINHADLVDTGFTPQLVLPDNDYFSREGSRLPMQLAKGRSWHDLLEDDDKPLDLHLKIAITAAKQMQSLWQEKGLLILDRCEVNIFVTGTENGNEAKFNVYHIDLEDLYDCKLGGKRTNQISPEGDFVVEKLDHPEESEAYNIATAIRHKVLTEGGTLKSASSFRENWSYSPAGDFQVLIDVLTAMRAELKVGV